MDQPLHNPKLFNYRSVIGKLNYLAQISCPNILYAVHQCSHFSSDPWEPHTMAIVHLAKYCMGTRSLGFCFFTNPKKSLEFFSDAKFFGNWSMDFDDTDTSAAKSHPVWIIHYAGCLIWWASKVQTHVSTSITMAEYIALSSALCNFIPIMELLEEMTSQD